MTFINEPALELRRAEVRDRATAALADLDARLPIDVPVLIDGRPAPGTPFDSVDPGNPATVVARVQGASAAQADTAVAAAAAAYPEWSARTGHERAEIVRRAAALLRSNRLGAAALAVRECGKPWADADADVCEAIDFLEYYANGAAAMDDGQPLLQMPGERNALRYVGRGVTAVIAPWNFPLAIATGMVSAALVTGNTVVFKPAEQAPACARLVVDALHAAGVPHGALALLPGGDEPGKALVAHPGVHTIAFTGSCAAGLSILETAARLAPGQRHIKRVVAEMGGKNCVVVDEDADLDDAVPGIVASAFAFAGQKCSAASRVLVHEAIADDLIERLSGAIATLQVGPAEDFATDVPPVIDREAQERVASYVDKGGAPAAQAPAAGDAAADGGPAVSSDGYYARPTLFVDLPEDHPVVTEEIFGPVLAVQRVPSIDAACEIVDAGTFALTGGIYSRSPRTIESFVRRSPVGNVYVNQPITGAMVGRQPFGGGRLSGTGPKAGGPDYLLQFVEARSVSEDTVRHGLVV
ncbi:aldehyde dehydrogenase family protein [Patulibacter americanus]|uniref:aldehyde dehydrogenase family protein n=1 Tax=Patulibacter americanus TaxID=588672 RepID=UPI000407AB43|nr:aldehyde dehydrogenase family protein [Patulibacter americanus]